MMYLCDIPMTPHCCFGLRATWAPRTHAEFVPDKFGFRRFPNDTDSLEQDLSSLGEQFISYAKLYRKTLFINATCELLAEIPVVEPGPAAAGGAAAGAVDGTTGRALEAEGGTKWLVMCST